MHKKSLAPVDVVRDNALIAPAEFKFSELIGSYEVRLHGKALPKSGINPNSSTIQGHLTLSA